LGNTTFIYLSADKITAFPQAFALLFSPMAFRIWRKFASLIRVPVVTRMLRWAWRLLPVLVMMDIGYLVGIWPEWELYSEGPIQRSSFIRSYEFEQHRHPDWPKLRWNPVSIERIPQSMF
jgi:hypothetical protein